MISPHFREGPPATFVPMNQTSSRGGIVAVAVFAVMAFTACATQSGADVPAPQPSASADATAGATASASTPSPSAHAAGAKAVVVTATTIEVRGDSDDLIASYDYFQPTDEVVSGLTAAFGGEPVTAPYEGESHLTPGVTHSWGGFTLVDTDYPGRAPYEGNHHVLVSSATENGVQITTVDGIAVGDSAAALEASNPDSSERVTAGGLPERLDVMVGSTLLPADDTGAHDATAAFRVWVIAADSAGTVTEIRSPSPNFG